MQTEEWRSVPGFEGLYEVSTFGGVRSLDRVNINSNGARRTLKGRRLKPWSAGLGYHMVGLLRDGRKSKVYVHALVLEVFVGPRPKGFDACHNDGVRTNNRLDNLRWDTRRGNMADRVEHGTHARGERCPTAKLTANQVMEIRRIYAAGGVTHKDIAQRFGVSRAQVGRIIKKTRWAHV